MNLDVYNVDDDTYLGTLSAVYGDTFLDDLVGLPDANFMVDVQSTADLALLVPRRVVRFRAGATPGTDDRAAFLVQDRPADSETDIELASGQTLAVVTYECPGLLAWLGYREGGMVLEPHGGLDGMQQNPRLFGWYAADYDDAAWTTVTGSTYVSGPMSTDGWPDPNAVGYLVVLSGDRALYRRTLPEDVDAAGPARLHVAATWQTSVKVWIDGNLVLEKPAGKSGMFYTDLPYEGTGHQIAVEVKGGAGKWGLAWTRLVETTDGDGNEQLEAGTPLVRTFDPADYPTSTEWVTWQPAPSDWLEDAYDDSDWVRPMGAGALSTSGWPDASAVAYRSVSARMRYRRLVESDTGDAGATINVAATWKLAVRVYLDEVLVLTKLPGETGVITEDVAFPAVDTQLAVLVSGEGRWGLTWLDSADSPLLRTYDPDVSSPDEPWVGSPDPIPGVNVGYVLDLALGEQDDDGHHPMPFWTFNGAQTSDVELWEVEFSRGFRLQELGLLLDELTFIEGEPEMTPAGVLRYVKRRGQDRTATVTVTTTASLSMTGRGPQATRWLYETDGGLGKAVNHDAEATWGVRMSQFVQLGTDVSPDGIGPALIRQLVEDGQVVDEIDVELPDGIEPYVDVFLGDSVMCDGRDGTTASVRLTSFFYHRDATTGHETWVATAVPYTEAA